MTLSERMLYPVQLFERWTEEYEAIDSVSERTDWVAEKVEECKVLKAVRAMKQFENITNPLCSSMRNFAKHG